MDQIQIRHKQKKFLYYDHSFVGSMYHTCKYRYWRYFLLLKVIKLAREIIGTAWTSNPKWNSQLAKQITQKNWGFVKFFQALEHVDQ